MKLHANARTCPLSRSLLITRIEAEGWSIQEAAAAAGISTRTAAKWKARFAAEGAGGLVDRSSAPKTVANRSSAQLEDAVAALRRLRFSGPQIAELLDRPDSTVSAILKRLGWASSAVLALSRPGATSAPGRAS